MNPTMPAPAHPKPASEQHGRRREEFLRVAAAVFARRGYRGAGMREIAEQCGVQPAALYYYFPSKVMILAAICQYGVTRFVECLATIQAADLPVETKVRDAVRAHLEPLIENQFYVHAFLFQRRELPVAVRRPLDQLARDYEDLWLALLVEGQSKGVMAKGLDRRITVLAILGMCNAVARWSQGAGGLGLEPVASAFSGLISYGLFSQRGAPAGARAGAPARHRRPRATTS